MALKPIRARLRNHSNGLAKIQLNVAAGDEIEVSEDVAAQLAHQGAPFSEIESETAAEPVKPKPAKKAPAKKAPAKKAPAPRQGTDPQ